MNATTSAPRQTTVPPTANPSIDSHLENAESESGPERVIVRQASLGSIFGGTSAMEDELLRSVISGRLRL